MTISLRHQSILYKLRHLHCTLWVQFAASTLQKLFEHTIARYGCVTSFQFLFKKTENLEFWMWDIIFLYQYTSYMRTLMMGFLSSIDSKLIKTRPNLNLKIFAIHLVIVHPYEAINLVFDSGSIVSISTNSCKYNCWWLICDQKVLRLLNTRYYIIKMDYNDLVYTADYSTYKVHLLLLHGFSCIYY